MSVLVIRLTALGDVVLVEPAIRALRARVGPAQIDLLTEARFAPLGPGFFGVDRVIGWDRHGSDRGIAGMGRVLGRLAPHYDAVVDLQGKLRTRMLAARVSAETRIVLKKRTLAEGLASLFGRDRPIADRHTVELYLAALAPLGVGAPPPAEPVRGIEPTLERGSARVRVGLSPGATHATKRWPSDRFGALADRIHDAIPGTEFVLIGGPNDRAELAVVRASCRRARIRDDDVASLDVRGLAGAIASLDLLVSVDTGPAHLAASLGVNVVAIFGPTSPVRWGPRGEGHRVVSLGLECSPCSNVGGDVCPLPSRSHECMEALPVERVLEGVLSALGAKR